MNTDEMNGHRHTILLVDDAPANLGVVVECMEHHGYEMLVAVDGEEALQRLEVTRPDLILLDVMMPGMDGFEVCRRLKAQQHTRDIPVIFMSALSMSSAEDQLAGIELGAVDYITKPLRLDKMLDQVGKHLGRGHVAN